MRKQAIHLVLTQKGECGSNSVIVSKKDGRDQLVVNLKKLNGFLTYQHCKMEGIHLVRDLLQLRFEVKNRFEGYIVMCSTPQGFKKEGKGREGKLYEFLCLCFGLGTAL